MAKVSKNDQRLRRARRARMKMRELGASRLTVHRTPRHTYAQVIDAEGKVLASANTVQKDVRSKVKNGGNIEAAKVIGEMIADRAKKAGVEKVAFDKSGFKYHGRVQALADAAREKGLQF